MRLGFSLGGRREGDMEERRRDTLKWRHKPEQVVNGRWSILREKRHHQKNKQREKGCVNNEYTWITENSMNRDILLAVAIDPEA
jgi:hypothetical protein